MKVLLKLFLSAVFIFPIFVFAAEFEENPFGDEYKKRLCLNSLTNAIRQCENGRIDHTHRNMNYFYNECVIEKGYTLDLFTSTRMRANTCWARSVQSLRGSSGVSSLILYYFPNDLN